MIEEKPSDEFALLSEELDKITTVINLLSLIVERQEKDIARILKIIEGNVEN